MLASLQAGQGVSCSDGTGPFFLQASFSAVPLAPPPAVLEVAPVEFNAELRQHQRLYQETAALDQFYQELRREEPHPPAPALAPALRSPVEGTSCLACNKRFPSAESLEKHCKLSEQHRRNLGLAAPAPAAAALAAAAAPAAAAPEAPAGLRRSGLGLGAAPQPEVDERALSYKDRGYRATLSRFNQ